MTGPETGSPNSGGERGVTLTAVAIAELVKGELEGDGSVVADHVAPLSRARSGSVSFLADGRYVSVLADSEPGVLLVTPELRESATRVPARIVVAKPAAALVELLPRFYPPGAHAPAIHSTAVIGHGARLGEGVTIEPYAVIGDGAVLGDGTWIGAFCSIAPGVRIGARSRLQPHVTVYGGSDIGERVILHSGVCIGSDGFGYVFADGEHRRIPHVGRCIIENDVEIGANTTVDRGSIDDTVIGAGTKIDNLVQIGHNVRVGRLCLIMAQVGIAGSSHIGDGCVLAGQAGLGGHITVGAGARIGGQSGVFGNVPPGEVWSGYPARPHRESLRATGALFRLAGMVKQIERIIERNGER